MKAVQSLLVLGLVAFVSCAVANKNNSNTMDIISLDGNKLSMIQKKLEEANMSLHGALRQLTQDNNRRNGYEGALTETSMTVGELRELIMNVEKYAREAKQMLPR